MKSMTHALIPNGPHTKRTNHHFCTQDQITTHSEIKKGITNGMFVFGWKIRNKREHNVQRIKK